MGELEFGQIVIVAKKSLISSLFCSKIYGRPICGGMGLAENVRIPS